MVPAVGRLRARAPPPRAALLPLFALLGAALLFLPAWATFCLLLAGGGWCLHAEPPGRAQFRAPRQLPKPCLNGGPSPSPSPRALLMGSYLGRPQPVAEGARGQQQRLREVLHRPNPGVCSPQRRLSYGDTQSMSRFTLAPRRRYPIQQTQYALLGALPTVRWDGYQRKNVLSTKNSFVAHSPVTVKIAPPDNRITRSPILEQLASPVLPSPANITQDPCARETVLNALKASRKRVVEEDCTFLDGQDNKRRRHDSSGSGQSAFEPLVGNGAPASLIPKPGILKRVLNSQCIDDHLNKRSRTSSISSLKNISPAGIPTSVRNAITSSYSSTRGYLKIPKRSGASESPLSSPSTSRSQTPERPAKKTREEELQQQSNESTPVRSDGKEKQTGKDLVFAVQKSNSENKRMSPGSDGKRKRKNQLLTLRRRDPLTLPPPPQLGYTVTAEDLEAEKKAALQYINKALEEDTSAPSACTATEITASSPSLTFTLATSVTAKPTTCTNTLLGSPKELQNPLAVTEPASVSASIPAPSKPLFSSAPSATLVTSSFTPTSLESKLLPTWSLASSNVSPPPTSMAQSAIVPTQMTLSMPTVISQTMAGEPPKQSSLMSILLEKPSTETHSAPQPNVIGTGTPTFKPIFGALPKGDSPMSPVVSTCTPAPTTATTTTFKPIFGNLATPATVSATSVSPFSFGQSMGTAATSAPAQIPTASSAIFTGLANSAYTTMATAASTANAPTDTTKPSFAFGLQAAASVPSSTITSTHSITTAQPFQFGVAASNTTTSAGVGFGTSSMFQFNKQTASTVTVSAASVQPMVSSFGQASSSSAPASSGFAFGGTPAIAPTTAGTSQPAMTFGSTASFFSSGSSSFSMNTNAPPPPYSNTSGQTAQLSTTKPAVMTFGNSASPFNFGSSSQAAQVTFASGTQPAFGAGSQGSFGTGGSAQPAFGSTKPVGTSTNAVASGFGSSVAQTTSGPMFGSVPQNQFGFASSSQPSNSGSAFGLGAQSSSGAPTMSGFSFGTGQSAVTTNNSAFGSSAMAQNVLGTPNQSTSFAFGTASTNENRPAFGGSSTPTFGQSSAGGGSLSFGTPSTPGMGFSPGPSFGAPSTTGSFSIGAGSKTSGTRQRLQARRQHTRKK